MHGFATDTMNDVHYEILLRENEKKWTVVEFEKLGKYINFKLSLKDIV